MLINTLYSFVAPSQAPPNIRILSKITHNTLKVSWDSIPQEYVHGDLKGYKVHYKRSMQSDKPFSPDSFEIETTHPFETAVTLKNLIPNSKYRVFVLASNENGDGVQSLEVIGGKWITSSFKF